MTWCTRHTQGHENWQGCWGGGGLAATSYQQEWKRGHFYCFADLFDQTKKNQMEWRWLPSFTWNSRNKTTSHLVRLVPLGRVGVVHMFGGEMLRADPCYGIRVRQAGHHPFHIAVLSCQVLCLQQVDPHHSLKKKRLDVLKLQGVKMYYSTGIAGGTLGRGERNWATCRPWTRGTTRRFGNTKQEAMASIIMLSDMTLRQRGNGYTWFSSYFYL